MTAPSTRRQKVRAMADQTASPEEAAVAKAMLAKTANTPEERLEVIADEVRDEWGRGIDTQFRVGHLLIEAKAIMPATQDFGAWLDVQDFPFGRKTAGTLREAAGREPEVRAFIADRNARSGQDIGPTWAVRLLNAGPKPVADGTDDDDAGELIPVTDATPSDPAYALLRDATQAIVGTEEAPGNAFLSMHVDDLAKCAGYIKDLATAYNAAKAAYGA